MNYFTIEELIFIDTDLQKAEEVYQKDHDDPLAEDDVKEIYQANIERIGIIRNKIKLMLG